MARGAGRLAMAGRGALRLMRFAWEAPAQARRDGAELVLSFARAVDADILRSGGGAHSRVSARGAAMARAAGRRPRCACGRIIARR